MPITRLYNYLPGSLAKGEDVQDEYDAIIAFINGLETDKLDVVGGTVANLTVSGNFIANGTNAFNGISTFDANASFNAGKHLTLGAGSNLIGGGTGSFAGLLTATGGIQSNGANIFKKTLTIQGDNGSPPNDGTNLTVLGNNSTSLLDVNFSSSRGGNGAIIENGLSVIGADRMRIRGDNLRIGDGSTMVLALGSIPSAENPFASNIKGFLLHTFPNTYPLVRMTPSLFTMVKSLGGNQVNINLSGATVDVTILGLPIVNPGAGKLWVDTGAGNVLKLG